VGGDGCQFRAGWRIASSWAWSAGERLVMIRLVTAQVFDTVGPGAGRAASAEWGQVVTDEGVAAVAPRLGSGKSGSDWR
jgi:hypothetical protein